MKAGETMRRQAGRGFTLVELLVAMALLSLLVVALMGLVDGATKLWRRNEARVESAREARAALHLIAAELQSIAGPVDGRFFRIDPSEGSPKIEFLASLPLTAQGGGNRGDLCAVAYFLAKGRVSDIGAASRDETWNLYRYLLQSNETYEKLLENPEQPDFWPAGELTPLGAKAEILARNVRAFRLRPYAVDGGELKQWTRTEQHPVPSFLEIEIETVNTETAKRFGGEIRGNQASILPHVEKWKTRVALRNASAQVAQSAPGAPPLAGGSP